jgi:hypothetical protein
MCPFFASYYAIRFAKLAAETVRIQIQYYNY